MDSIDGTVQRDIPLSFQLLKQETMTSYVILYALNVFQYDLLIPLHTRSFILITPALLSIANRVNSLLRTPNLPSTRGSGL